MEVNEELILKVAKNAKLSLTEAEVKEFVPEFKEILEAFSKLNEVDTQGVKPSLQPVKIKNVTREDVAASSVSQEEILSNTIHKKNGYFMGPKAL